MQQLGRYEIREEIARGGMGVVYKAYDPASDRVVAIKVMLAAALSRPAAQKRFQREADALARIQHPNVVRLLDFDLTPRGQPFMVLEFVEGSSLQDQLGLIGAFDPESAAERVTTLCEALTACHQTGVLHRDLKPANVLIHKDGSLKLTDFGLVRDVDPSFSRTQLTQEGDFHGSPGYWAPEQAAGELTQISPRTDVYGLGATLFALLTGRPPYQGRTMAELLEGAHTKKQAPSSLNSDVPAWLDAVVARALANDPGERFASPEELAAALTARSPGRSRSTSLLVLVGVGVGGLLAVSFGSRSDSPREASPEVPPASAAPDTSMPAPLETPSQSGEPARPDSPGALAFERGRELSRGGQHEEARQAFSESIRLAPDNFAPYAMRAGEHRALGELDEAIADLTEAIRLQPRHPQPYLIRGEVWKDLGDIDAAISDWTEAIRRDPNLAEAYRNRGVHYGLRGQFQEMADDTRELIRLEPEAVDGHLNHGTARYQLGDWEAVVASTTTAVRLDPEEQRGYYLRGTAYIKLGEIEAAESDFSATIRLRPDRADAYLNRAIVRLSLGKGQNALKDLDEAIRLEPDSTPAYDTRSSLRFDFRDFQGAAADCTAVLGLQPTPQHRLNALTRRGNVHAILGAYPEAIADFTAALELQPDNATTQAQLAEVWVATGDRERAIAGYTEALRLDPNMAAVLHNRGVMHKDQGEYQQALEDLTAAVRLRPGDVSTLAHRGQVRGSLGDARGAVADYTEVLRLDPSHGTALHNRAVLRTQLGEVELALEDFTQAIRLQPGNAKLHANRGFTRMNASDYVGAVADFEQALQLDPNYPGASKLLEAAREKKAAGR